MTQDAALTLLVDAGFEQPLIDAYVAEVAKRGPYNYWATLSRDTLFEDIKLFAKALAEFPSEVSHAD